ncbi:hypothetical protein AAVH_35455, partial [Aphelenchoides avenae]
AAQKKASSEALPKTILQRLKSKDNQALTLEERKRRLQEAQTALGRKPNTRIVDLMEKTREEVNVKSVSQRSTLKTSDIAFPLSKRKKPKDDDTLNPNADPDDFNEDVPEEPPNSQTYMYNEKDVQYIANRLMEEFTKADISRAYDDVKTMCEEKVDWDPYAKLDTLESRRVFQWRPLHVNTYLTNSDVMPNDEEITAANAVLARTTDGDSIPRVTFRDSAKSISKYGNDRAHTGTTQEVLTLEVTPKSESGTPRRNTKTRVDKTMATDEQTKNSAKGASKRGGINSTRT